MPTSVSRNKYFIISKNVDVLLMFIVNMYTHSFIDFFFFYVQINAEGKISYSTVQQRTLTAIFLLRINTYLNKNYYDLNVCIL